MSKGAALTLIWLFCKVEFLVWSFDFNFKIAKFTQFHEFIEKGRLIETIRIKKNLPQNELRNKICANKKKIQSTFKKTVNTLEK